MAAEDVQTFKVVLVGDGSSGKVQHVCYEQHMLKSTLNRHRLRIVTPKSTLARHIDKLSAWTSTSNG